MSGTPHNDFNLPPPAGASTWDLNHLRERIEHERAGAETFMRMAERLKSQVVSTTLNLMQLVELAGGVRPGKSLGCERCSACTLKIACLMETWFQSNACPVEDMAPIQFKQLASFPRSLVRLILSSLKLADSPTHADYRNVLATELQLLCEAAIEEFGKRSMDKSVVLAFSRVAAVLKEILPAMTSVMGKHVSWPGLRKQIDAVQDLTAQVDQFLDSRKQDHFLELRYFDVSPHSRIEQQANKRVCGGGYTQPRLGSTGSGRGQIHVIDFSKEHFLGVVHTPLEGIQTGWEFCPCQRELPFTLTFETQKRRLKADSHFPTYSTDLQQCGCRYQLFKICSVEPGYYYRALVAQTISTNRRLLDSQIMERHDWPITVAGR
jgi:hypothetical protein